MQIDLKIIFLPLVLFISIQKTEACKLTEVHVICQVQSQRKKCKSLYGGASGVGQIYSKIGKGSGISKQNMCYMHQATLQRNPLKMSVVCRLGCPSKMQTSFHFNCIF
uniref:Putative ovule protein n=1 Tax=Solanum chacoense TaxID=4108 RepID=A0A0V0I010_SOLCH